LIAQIEQRRELRISDGHHVASMPAVTAVRAAARHKLFPAKANTPPPAVAGDYANLYFIDEFHLGIEFRSQYSEYRIQNSEC
jgi:hypothetical protein